VGLSDTATADPLSPFCFYVDCLVTNGFTFDKRGKLTRLGALPGSNNSSVAYGINAAGMAAGVSSTGSFDPATGFPETHAVFGLMTKSSISELWGERQAKPLP
jgi:hypothetical protein